MRVIDSSDRAPESVLRPVIAIGNFDGVHRGHRVLIAEAYRLASGFGAASGVMIFEPHPREFFHPEEPHFILTPLSRKLDILAGLGLDVAFVETFDIALARMSAEDFIAERLVERLAVRHVVVGYDFFFGKKRGGSPATMREAGERYGFGVTVIDPVAEEGEVFSSTAIRLRLAQSDVKSAAAMLGARWQVSGTVVGGAKRGTGLGYPTANIPMPRGTALGHGIYAVRVHAAGKIHDGAAYLGTRPTYDNGKPVLEVFLLDFDGDLYGQTISVEFVDFIRADRKFGSSEDLVAQMDKDVAAIRAILAAL